MDPLLDQKQIASELLPSLLCQAAVAVLGLDGAGLSITEGPHRVPLGASDAMAGTAERLQFTLGQGPCLEAAARHEPVVATEKAITSRWPQFAAEFFRRTTYRALVSVPLHIESEPIGALDLYAVDPADLDALAFPDVQGVANIISRVLSTGNLPEDRAFGPVSTWTGGTAARQRSQIWIAVGMLMSAFDLAGTDALALLRAYAFTAAADLDDIAAELTSGRLSPGLFKP